MSSESRPDGLEPAHVGGRIAATSAGVTIGAQAVRLVLQLGGVVVLARVLLPGDFGAMAMITSIVGVGAILRDFGLGQAAVQARELSAASRSNLFWVNTAFGTAVAVLVCLAAAPIAAFYDRPDLRPVVMVMALSFVFYGAATQFRAHLARNLRFARLAVAEVGAQAVALALALLMALSGLGLWALVAQHLAEALLVASASAVLARWRPGRYERGQRIGPLLRYGWNVTWTQSLVFFSQNVDNVLIGKLNGATALGYYSRAFQLLMVPVTQVAGPSTRVSLALLSRLQDDRPRYDAYLLRGHLLLGGGMTVVMAFASAHAADIVAVLLGSTWAPSAPIFSILAVAGCFHALNYSTFWVFLSRAMTGSNLRFTLCTRPLVIVAVLLGTPWGAKGVAVGYAAGLGAVWLIGLYWIRRVAPVGALFLVGVRMLAVAGSAAGGSWLVVRWAAGDLPAFGRVAIGLGALALMVAAIARVVPSVGKDVAQILSTFGALRRGHGPSTARGAKP